jgi:threonine/homoserine/homoserine lactone efflux protein
VREDTLIYVSLVGCLYIAYLAIKIASDSGELGASEAPARPLGVRSGFVIQLLNPKAMIATLPITSIQFPAAQIHGWSLLPWSLLLGHSGCICSRNFLLASAWNITVPIQTRTVDVHIAKLRKKLNLGPDDLKTVMGRGYALSMHESCRANRSL